MDNNLIEDLVQIGLFLDFRSFDSAQDRFRGNDNHYFSCNRALCSRIGCRLTGTFALIVFLHIYIGRGHLPAPIKNPTNGKLL